MSDLRCENREADLQDFVEGLLGPGEERRMREHLAGCESCRRGERDLRRLFTRVAELPREISPPRDLWPGIADRIGESRVASRAGRESSPPLAASRSRPPRRGWTARPWLSRAAAALAFMALGALLAQLARPVIPPGPNHDDSLRPSGRVLPASGRAVGLEEVEAEYLRAKEALWLLVYSRHDELSPVTVEIVRRNLLIVDEAIRDLREALREDPGNRQLAASLLAQHRRGIHLLHRLTRTDPPEDRPAAG